MFALPISKPRFKGIIFFIKIALKFSYFCKKCKIFEHWGLSPKTRGVFRGGALGHGISDFGRKITLNFGEDLFFFFFFLFWRSPNFGRKKPLNFGFRPKNHSELWRRPCFFFWGGGSPDFGQKKPLNFRAFQDISPQVSDKPSETDSRSMKIRVKVVCTLLTLSK